MEVGAVGPKYQLVQHHVVMVIRLCDAIATVPHPAMEEVTARDQKQRGKNVMEEIVQYSHQLCLHQHHQVHPYQVHLQHLVQVCRTILVIFLSPLPDSHTGQVLCDVVIGSTNFVCVPSRVMVGLWVHPIAYVFPVLRTLF